MACQWSGSRISFVNSENNYENVTPPHFLRQQPGAPVTVKPGWSSRKMLVVVLYILVCASLFIATIAFVLVSLIFFPRCPKHWEKFQTKCYYFSDQKHSWDESRHMCSGFGAYLVVIHDSETEQFVDNHNNYSYWLGLKKYGKAWLWADDTRLKDNSQIKRNENQTTHCVYVNHEISPSQKVSESCSKIFHYICVKQA